MPEFKLNISPDKMAAHLNIETDADGAVITIEDIKNYLNREKVIFGFDEENIKTAVENKIWGQEIIFA